MPATEERQYLKNLSRDLFVGRGLMMSKYEHVQIQIVIEAEQLAVDSLFWHLCLWFL